MTTVTRDQVKQAAREKDATIVEVLDRDAFEEFHLPGAIHVPLDDQFETRIQSAVPGKEERVIVYCKDTDCQASTKAANRMEQLGYQNVYDYEAGKMDWKQAGLPIEN